MKRFENELDKNSVVEEFSVIASDGKPNAMIKETPPDCIFIKQTIEMNKYTWPTPLYW